jgi:60 kDa SS-A/Ro ribonucleoprotein
MSKFNGTNKTNTNPTGKNMAGGVSYDRPIKKEIATVVLNSMLNGNSYYEKETDRLNRIEKLLTQSGTDAEFVAKAMVYTRDEGRLRSVSHFMAGLLAENVKGEKFLKPAFVKAIMRPDDMTEMLALWNSRNKGKMVPNSLRRAFKTALETKFDEYQFRKYAAPKAQVKLKDVVKLAHPSPKNFEDETIFKRVIEDNLAAIETAQTINAGKTGKDRVDAYVDQIKSGKMGYMGTVKNIRTMLENGISEDDLKVWANMITDPKRVRKSMMLPFRFVDAWDSVKDLAIDEFKKRIVKKALERAFGLSAGNTNIAEDGEKVAILLDESGSMGGSYGYGDENKTQPFYIGKTLAAAMKVGMNEDDCLFYTWADTCTRRDVNGTSPFDFIKNMNTRGGGTDVAAPLKELIKTGTFVDKIVILTDMQMYGSWGRIEDQINTYLKEYRKINPNVKVLFWNLQGYGGGAPIDLEKTRDVFEVSGFSDKMLEVIPKLWSNPNFLVETIEAVKL